MGGFEWVFALMNDGNADESDDLDFGDTGR
jgi:hypothetical protein